MIGLNIQTSFLTPPFGFALFYLRGVAPPSVKTTDMYKGVIAFISLQLLALAIVGNYPALVNYLPNRVSLTSETAPPPLNPRLQYCMEEYAVDQFAVNGNAITGAISTARGLDYSMLPESMQKEIMASFDQAESAFDLLAKAKQAEAEIEAHAPEYAPLHTQVRQIESDILRLEHEIADLKLAVRRGGPDHPRKAVREERIEKRQAEADALRAKIPAAWDEAHKTFLTYTKAERTARLKYRRAVDDAYAPITELRTEIADTAALEALGTSLRELQAATPSMDTETAISSIEEMEKQVGAVSGSNDIRSHLSKARRALKSRTPDPAASAESLAQAVATYDETLAWRKQAEAKLKVPLAAYDVAIRDTIGLRGQPRRPREQALYVAGCNSVHRNVSLSF
jgi:DNA repair exonuclease SbcCD ATPase subunit